MIAINLIREVELSECARYRWSLRYTWAEHPHGHVGWIMLNPSTADADKDDPTIRRCRDFSKRWGYDGMHIVNLFSLRATDPKELKRRANPIGDKTDAFISAMALSCPVVVCAWGKDGSYMHRDARAKSLLAGHHTVICLGKTREHQPRHPLYVRADFEPINFLAPAYAADGRRQ